MKVGKKIGVIDTQDALIGNPTYDLVSLIDDVRIKNSNKLKNKIVFNLDNKPKKSSFFQFIIGAKDITSTAGPIINVVVRLK